MQITTLDKHLKKNTTKSSFSRLYDVQQTYIDEQKAVQHQSFKNNFQQFRQNCHALTTNLMLTP